MLAPTVHRTWSSVGQTPLLRHRHRNDRLSFVSRLSVSSRRYHLGLYGMFFWDNIGQKKICRFIREVRRHLWGRVIAVLDARNTHRGTMIKNLCAESPRLTLVYFPSCAPELNPDEGVWGWMKGRLANSCPDDLQELVKDLQREFRVLARSQARLKGCIQQSELHFLCPNCCSTQTARTVHRRPKRTPQPPLRHSSASARSASGPRRIRAIRYAPLSLFSFPTYWSVTDTRRSAPNR